MMRKWERYTHRVLLCSVRCNTVKRSTKTLLLNVLLRFVSVSVEITRRRSVFHPSVVVKQGVLWKKRWRSNKSTASFTFKKRFFWLKYDMLCYANRQNDQVIFSWTKNSRIPLCFRWVPIWCVAGVIIKQHNAKLTYNELSPSLLTPEATMSYTLSIVEGSDHNPYLVHCRRGECGQTCVLERQRGSDGDQGLERPCEHPLLPGKGEGGSGRAGGDSGMS
jgi:hypothetical protein